MNNSNPTDAAVEAVFLRTLKLTQGLADGDAATFQHVLTRRPESLRRALALIGSENSARSVVLRTLLGVENDIDIASLRDGWVSGALIEYEYEATAGNKIAYWEIGETGDRQKKLNAEEFRHLASYHPNKNAIYRVAVSGPFVNCAAGLVIVDTPPTDRTPTTLASWPASLELTELAALVRVGHDEETKSDANGAEAAVRRWERFCPVYRVPDDSPRALDLLLDEMRRLPAPLSREQLRAKVLEYLIHSAAPALRSIAESAHHPYGEQREQRLRRELGWYLREFRCAAEELILEQKRNLKNDLRLQLLAHPLTKTGLILQSRREALLGTYFASQFGPRLRLLIKRQAILLERTLDRLSSAANHEGALDSISERWLVKVQQDVDLRGATTSVLIASSPLMFAAAASTAADFWDMGKVTMPLAHSLSKPMEPTGFAKKAQQALGLDKFIEGINQHIEQLTSSVQDLGNVLVKGFQILLLQQVCLGIGSALVGIVKVKEHFVLHEMEDEIDHALDDLGMRLDEAIGELDRRLLAPPELRADLNYQTSEATELLDEINTWREA